MRQIGITRPHIKAHVLPAWGRIWYCAMRGIPGTGLGYSPQQAFRDWDRWIYSKEVGHSFKPVSGKNSLETVKG